ncbi:class I SAM-dependent methyltransferase [Christiangramia echinicola]|uniref:class I SAM-dependent methyltransferase n=1 Tax=Christiangramia echinicola TaxID=279359 RepID=UPI0005553CB9|nr:class I SAM-dependent methyltransferase [Christiangramia echinicola]
MDREAEINREKNKRHYERLYGSQSIDNILFWIKDVDRFLSKSQAKDTSWNALYRQNFKESLPGKKVMEMGCGDCVNAAIMAALGAEVYANDIAGASGIIIEKLNAAYDFEFPIKFIEGDFLKNRLKSNQFDFVIGKAFLHHLTINEESEFLKETARLLKKNGEARFFEPAVNSWILDEIRWIIPVKGRPSKLNRKKFKVWKQNDPHPDRSFSSRHFINAGKGVFNEVQIIPVGALERISRIIPYGGLNSKYRIWALNTEKKIPKSINKYITRSQLIIYRKPIR